MVVKRVIETDIVFKTQFFSEKYFAFRLHLNLFDLRKILTSQEQELRLAAKKGPVERTHELED